MLVLAWAVITLFAAAAAIVLYAQWRRHRAPDAAWQHTFDRLGGATRRFDGYDQAQAERALREYNQRFARRYGRFKAKQRSKQKSPVITFESKRKAAR